MNFAHFLLVSLLAINGAVASNYKYSAVLSGSINYVFSWNLTTTRLYVSIQANTVGWVGVGFAPGLTMAGADLNVGWVTSTGAQRIGDYYATSNTLPSYDSIQSLSSMVGTDTGTVTTITYNRLLNTGDSNDFVITPFTSINVLWAYGSSDPSGTTLANNDQHTDRGVFPIMFCYDCTVPTGQATPTLVNVTSTSCFIAWNSPANVGGGTTSIISNTLQRNDGAGGSTYTQVCSGRTNLCSVNGLTAGLSYNFQVSSTNEIGTSSFSASLVVTILNSLPSQMNPPALSSTSRTSLTITWIAPSSTGGTPISSYTLYRNGTSVYTGGLLSTTISSLLTGTLYGVAVTSTNSLGAGPLSAYAYYSTDSASATVAGAPTSLSASSITRTTVTFKWTDPVSNGGANIVSYIFQVSPAVSPAYNLTIPKVTNAALQYVVVNLTAAVTYQFSIAAVNSQGTSNFSVSVSATTSALIPVPTTLNAPVLANVREKSITVSWNAAQSPVSINGYILQRSQYMSVSQQWNTTSISLDNQTLIFVDSGLIGSSVYSYSVASTDAGGTSLLSLSTNATTIAPLQNSAYDATFYDNSVNVDSNMQVGWKVFDANSTNPMLEFALVVQGTGWVGLGVNTDVLMAGADMIVGYCTKKICLIFSCVDTMGAHVSDYYATGEVTPNEDTMQPGGHNDIESYTGSEVNGVTTIRFRRSFLGLDDSAGYDQPYSTTGQTTLIYAYHLTSDRFIQHDSYGGFKVSLMSKNSAVTTLASTVPWWKTIHGLLMGLSWLVGVPIAIIMARHFKYIGHSWYVTHYSIMTASMVATVIAFVLALGSTLQDGPFLVGSPMLVAHGYLGIVVVIAAIVQPILGKLADNLWSPSRVSTPIFPDIVHQWIGRTAGLLAMINCVIGAVVINSSPIWLILIVAAIVVVFIAAVILHFVKPAKPYAEKLQSEARMTNVDKTAYMS